MVASDEIIEEAQVSLRFVNVAGNVVTSLHLCSSCAQTKPMFGQRSNVLSGGGFGFSSRPIEIQPGLLFDD